MPRQLPGSPRFCFLSPRFLDSFSCPEDTFLAKCFALSYSTAQHVYRQIRLVVYPHVEPSSHNNRLCLASSLHYTVLLASSLHYTVLAGFNSALYRSCKIFGREMINFSLSVSVAVSVSVVDHIRMCSIHSESDVDL